MQTELELAYNLCTSFWLAPKYDFKLGTFHISKWKILSIAFYINSVFSYNIYGSLDDVSNGKHQVDLELLGILAVYLGIMNSLLSVNICKPDKLAALLMNLNECNNTLQKYLHKDMRKCDFLIVITHVLLLGVWMFDVWTYFQEMGVLEYRFVIAFELLVYLNFCFILLECAFLMVIKNRISHFNEIIGADELDEQNIDEILAVYYNICDVVECFNGLFGWHMFFSIVQAAINALICIRFFITIKEMMMFAYRTATIVTWTIYFLVSNYHFQMTF